MPHLRSRYLEENIKKCMNFSGLVGILGHRQVGKTTLLEKLCSSYYTLDSKLERDEAKNNPAEFLKKRAQLWAGLDECQLVPELFPELKEWVRTHKKPGQFLISGSVRFTSREAIRESLTGRILNLELLPFTVSELRGESLPFFCKSIIESETLEKVLHGQLKSTTELNRLNPVIEQYYQCGGLPGICFVRDESLRRQKLIEQLNTLLDRDLRLVKKIQIPVSDIKVIVSSLANYQGLPLDYTLLKRESGISTPTIKKIIYALEAIFLIRQIPIEGSTKGHTYYFEDQAEHAVLSHREINLLEKMTHFCFANIRAQFAYRLGEHTEIIQYRTRGGALIPLVFRNKSGCLGVLPVQSIEHISSAIGSSNSFLKTYAKSKVLILFPETEKPQFIQPRILALPLGQVV